MGVCVCVCAVDTTLHNLCEWPGKYEIEER